MRRRIPTSKTRNRAPQAIVSDKALPLVNGRHTSDMRDSAEALTNKTTKLLERILRVSNKGHCNATVTSKYGLYWIHNINFRLNIVKIVSNYNRKLFYFLSIPTISTQQLE